MKIVGSRQFGWATSDDFQNDRALFPENPKFCRKNPVLWYEKIRMRYRVSKKKSKIWLTAVFEPATSGFMFFHGTKGYATGACISLRVIVSFGKRKKTTAQLKFFLPNFFSTEDNNIQRTQKNTTGSHIGTIVFRPKFDLNESEDN